MLATQKHFETVDFKHNVIPKVAKMSSMREHDGFRGTFNHTTGHEDPEGEQRYSSTLSLP